MKVCLVFLLFLVLFSSSPTFSQTNDEGLAFLQFNFLNPGARALALGGAFVALADDSTAALANPAGLTALIHPEFSIEFSSTSYDNEIPWNTGLETFFFDIVDVNNNVKSDFQFDFNPVDSSDTARAISFASFVYPVISSKFILSGYYNSQTDYERAFETDGFRICPSNLSEDFCTGFFPTRNSLDLSLRNFGFSGSVRMSDLLSIGATATLSQLKIDSQTARLDFQDRNVVHNTELLEGDDTNLSFTLGVLVGSPRKITAGFVYTKRPEFDVTSGYIVTGGNPPSPDQVLEQKFKVPDGLSAGVSIRPTDVLTVNFDVVRVFYSQLMDGYYNAFFNPVLTDTENSNDFQSTTLDVDDGTEFRVGAEYLFQLGGKYPFAIRGGYWREPFHSVIQTVDDADLREVRVNGVLQGDTLALPWFSRSLKEEFNHISFGTGIIFEKVTLDWAFDYSRNYTRFIISSVFRLDKLGLIR